MANEKTTPETTSKTTSTKAKSSSTAKTTATKTTATKTTATKSTATKSTAPKSTTAKTGTTATTAKTSATKATASKSTAPKTTASKTTTPKATTSKTAPKASETKATASKTSATTKAEAPSVAEASKASTASATAGATTNVKAQKVNATSENLELSKEAELQQKVASGGKAPAPKRKKNTGKKILFLIVLLLLIASVAVVGVFVVPGLIGSEKAPDIELTNPTEGGSQTGLDFESPVTEYQWGDSIDRGIAVQNTGSSSILLCFKLELYGTSEDGETIDESLPLFDITATPTGLNASLWTNTTLQDNGVTTKYYYYNDTIKSDASLVLFRQYVVNTVDPMGGNEYANKKVFSRVTVYYTSAKKDNFNNLESLDAVCWTGAPSEWKTIISNRI